MLYLASKSPRRQQLLAQLGYRFGTLDLDLPEIRDAGEAPFDYVSRVAREKAGAGLLQVSAQPGATVIGADTEVVLDDEVFGKPRDAADAASMLRRLSGRSHEVISVVWVVSAGREQRAVSRSEVRFDTLDDALIEGYVASGEAFGKAGAYAVQGRAAAFVAQLQGSYTGVMGLPVYETAQALAAMGWPALASWSASDTAG
ncbi:Maf family protein [Pseudomarimonas salicorniae]|uniref:dTTP/UTP pyrophosphatase n=1 Tax=Pseudomarimonas salicorniae TaxID=2933270 RepID=A0ABT0GKP4_9GAMM|nr:nucleoside triphosphate pyrophosphatase [Lysobacter sp. CAU 1642]MCK7595111.1 Maf family nucleotide pyrophosphatase [Lysobacter sp. CAU 1642]